MKESDKPYFRYVADVLSGRIVAGSLIRKACERFDSLLDRYEFRADKVDGVIRLFSFLRHFKGRHSGKPFILEPWQAWIVASIYGFYRDDGTRLVNTAYIEVARKNGKTALAAGIGLNALINDDEDGAEVYFAANSRDQVKISAWPLCSSFSKSFDPKGKYLKVFRDTVKYDRKQSWMKVLAADSTNAVSALRLGQLLSGTNLEEAEKYLNIAAANGQEANAKQVLGTAYLKKAAAQLKGGKYADAVALAEKANEIKENAQALLIAGQASQKLGKDSNAIAFFEKYLAADPNAKNSNAIAFTVGALFQKAGNKSKALEYYQKVASDPQFGAQAKQLISALSK